MIHHFLIEFTYTDLYHFFLIFSLFKRYIEGNHCDILLFGKLQRKIAAEKAANYLEYHAEILSKEEYQETLTLHENEETPTPGNTSEKMVEKTANPITREADLKANGYKLTPALKKHMDRLDQLTGRKNSVKDIYKAYKTHDFHGDPETEKTIKSIGKIFQRQEMQIKAVIPER